MPKSTGKWVATIIIGGIAYLIATSMLGDLMTTALAQLTLSDLVTVTFAYGVCYFVAKFILGIWEMNN